LQGKSRQTFCQIFQTIGSTFQPTTPFSGALDVETPGPKQHFDFTRSTISARPG
jgi:hypothetical protein